MKGPEIIELLTTGDILRFHYDSDRGIVERKESD